MNNATIALFGLHTIALIMNIVRFSTGSIKSNLNFFKFDSKHQESLNKPVIRKMCKHYFFITQWKTLASV
jgi:hypothetical protein